MPSGFVALFVIVLILAVGTSVYRASQASDLAERTGGDPGRAAWRVFRSSDPRAELRAQELEAELREQRRLLEQATPRTGADERTVAERLQDLQDLYRRGLVNEDEFAEKRREILDDV